MRINEQDIPKTEIDLPEVIVMGAGAAGIGAALKLSKEGYKVILIEKGTLSCGSSGRNPGRMGHGFHYADVETAKMYLRASIQVQRAYPDYLVGKNLDFKDPLRHGRYFIMNDPGVNQETILHTYEELKKEYERLIISDQRNEVFGPPDDFYRFLNLEEEEHINQEDVKNHRIAVGIETAEHLFDWQSFIEAIRLEIAATENITLYENTEIHRLERGGLNQPRFTITASNEAGNVILFKSDYIVNSTWQNIEYFNDQLGLTMIPESRTNRLKALVIVELPDSLESANSMFFCMGQHCMFTNLGNKRGMITYANVTNMETSSTLALSNHANNFIHGKINSEEKLAIGLEILNGVAEYIPEMINAKISDVKFGIVQTAGKLTLSDLHNPQHNFHKRDYDGIREEQVGLISNPCMKLFYFVQNGNVVAEIIGAEVIATSIIKKTMAKIIEKDQSTNLDLFHINEHCSDIKKTIIGNMERYVTATELAEYTRTTSSTEESIVEKMSSILISNMIQKRKITNELSYLCIASNKNHMPSDIKKQMKSVPKRELDYHFIMHTMSSSTNITMATLPLILGIAAFTIGAILSSPLAIGCGVAACALGSGAGFIYRNSLFSNNKTLAIQDSSTSNYELK